MVVWVIQGVFTVLSKVLKGDIVKLKRARAPGDLRLPLFIAPTGYPVGHVLLV